MDIFFSFWPWVALIVLVSVGANAVKHWIDGQNATRIRLAELESEKTQTCCKGSTPAVA